MFVRAAKAERSWRDSGGGRWGRGCVVVSVVSVVEVSGPGG
ncbi:hypothetical protein FF86_100976 [Frankia sp. CpI1-P]|nr:hypothetical protein FF86_100976 [Frankia sp. CpI1-P]